MIGHTNWLNLTSWFVPQVSAIYSESDQLAADTYSLGSNAASHDEEERETQHFSNVGRSKWPLVPLTHWPFITAKRRLVDKSFILFRPDASACCFAVKSWFDWSFKWIKWAVHQPQEPSCWHCALQSVHLQWIYFNSTVGTVYASQWRPLTISVDSASLHLQKILCG